MLFFPKKEKKVLYRTSFFSFSSMFLFNFKFKNQTKSKLTNYAFFGSTWL